MRSRNEDDWDLSDSALINLLRHCDAEHRVRSEGLPSVEDDEIQSLLEKHMMEALDATERKRLERLVGDPDVVQLMLEACAHAPAEIPTMAVGASVTSVDSSVTASRNRMFTSILPHEDEWDEDENVDHGAMWAEVKQELLRRHEIKETVTTPLAGPHRKWTWMAVSIASVAAALLVTFLSIPFWHARDTSQVAFDWDNSTLLVPADGPATRGIGDELRSGARLRFTPGLVDSSRHRWILQIEDAAYLIGHAARGEPSSSVPIGVSSYTGKYFFLVEVAADRPTVSLTLGPVTSVRLLPTLLTEKEIRELQSLVDLEVPESRERATTILTDALRREFGDVTHTLSVHAFPYAGP